MNTVIDNNSINNRDIEKAQVNEVFDERDGARRPPESSLVVALNRKKNRCIRAILGAKERDIDTHVDEETAQRFRKVVLDEINDFFEYSKDILVAMPEGSPAVLNELYMKKILELHDHFLGE